MRILAISDIHACKRSFEALLEQIKLQKDDILYLLGDYIDRGPDSKGVLDLIMELQTTYNIYPLRGNHEQMLLDAFYQKKERSVHLWIRNGGDKAMDSFDTNRISQLPEKYINFLSSLPFYYQTDKYLFVHAGLDLALAHPLEDKKSLIWARRWHNWHEVAPPAWLENRIVVHGHTAIRKLEIENSFQILSDIPVLNIDCGCCFGRHLCAVDLTNKQLYFQANIE